MIALLVLTCVLVVASWEPNNFGLSLGANPWGTLGNTCMEWGSRYCVDTPTITLPSWLHDATSPVIPTIAFFILLGLIVSLNHHMRYRRGTFGALTGVIGQERVFYVKRGLAAHRARNKW
jgi:hypothetical protein